MLVAGGLVAGAGQLEPGAWDADRHQLVAGCALGFRRSTAANMHTAPNQWSHWRLNPSGWRRQPG